MIHPRANGVISASGEAALRQLNQHLKSISEDGVLVWRRISGYYRRSEVENMFYRYKILLGDQLRARSKKPRQVKSVLACNILNQFRLLGRPEYELVTWSATQRINDAYSSEKPNSYLCNNATFTHFFISNDVSKKKRLSNLERWNDVKDTLTLTSTD